MERVDFPVPNELTCAQSRSSGVASHLESSERNDNVNSHVAASGAAPDLEETVLLQRCWSGSGIS